MCAVSLRACGAQADTGYQLTEIQTATATAQARHTGEAEDVTVRLLRQRLSLLLMKGNSALLIGRVPEPEDPDGLFG